MNKLADLIEHDLEEFAQAESKDQGKNVNCSSQIHCLDEHWNRGRGPDF